MENKDNMLKYETPSLEELYLCPVVQGGPSTTELNEGENEETNKNNEDNW